MQVQQPKESWLAEKHEQTPCVQFARGHRNRGEKRLFMHGEKVAVVTEDEQPNSPKAKGKAKAAAAVLINDSALERTCAICNVECALKPSVKGKNDDAHSASALAEGMEQVGFSDIKDQRPQASTGDPVCYFASP